MVLVVVLAGQPLAHHARVVAVRDEPGGDRGGVVLVEEDAPHGPHPLPQAVAELGQEGPVGVQPVDVVQLVRPEPAHLVVLPGSRLPRHQAHHRDPQLVRRADRHRRREPADHLDHAAQLLRHLAHQCRGGLLAGLDLAAGELPSSRGRGGCGPARDEHPAPTHHGGTDDGLHHPKVSEGNRR